MNTKSNSFHTPGPWIVLEPYTDRYVFPISYALDNSATSILGEVNPQGGTAEQTRANAELIAAAPELIHAVELADAQLRKMGYECDCENLPNQCPLCACHSAIAKAKGQKS